MKFHWLLHKSNVFLSTKTSPPPFLMIAVIIISSVIRILLCTYYNTIHLIWNNELAFDLPAV